MRQNSDTTSPHDRPLVEVDGLVKLFPVAGSLFRKPSGFVHAVDDVSFSIARGKSLALVGESGCGKTTVGKLLVKLIEPTAGSMSFRFPVAAGESTQEDCVDPSTLKGRELRRFRRQVQLIFQDPYESMNPRLTIYDTVAEPLAVQGIGNPLDRVDRVAHMLGLVGLNPAGAFLFRYPHELSGGQRQRVAIARALIVGPSLVVADEPTSMLDVSSRTGIMTLMQELAGDMGVAYLYITHDLAVARYMCDRIAVMYMGKVVEIGDAEDLLHNPLHPYTKALLSAVPVPDPDYHRAPPDISGEVTVAVDPMPRCRFFDRCPAATSTCETGPHPPLEEKAPNHYAACYEV